MKPLSIVIVGGGTSGWITASVLHRRLNQPNSRPVRITLVESKRIGIIGVGEATVPTIRTLLKFLGIPEPEFIAATSASFKHGILYCDWKTAPGTPHNHYFHPFDFTNILNFSPPLWWLACRAHLPEAHYAGEIGAQYDVAMAGRAPRRPDMPPFEGVTGYAYHLDAEQFAEFLAARVTRTGVVRVIDDVVDTLTHADGSVSAIVTAEHGTIEGDFFVDCTGFAGLLINRTLGVDFLGYNDSLFCDRAVALRVPTDEDEPMRPYTTTTAKQSGWVWEIDLQTRRGTGYVYSSRHVSPEVAEAELRRHVGPRSEALEARHLRMRVGRSARFWHKNVAAIGLSGGFIEPLESTGIYLIEAGAVQLGDSLQAALGLAGTDAYAPELATLSRLYDSRMIGLYEEIRDFIKLHYFLSRRRDSAFWRDNTDPSSAPASLLALLDRWAHRPPQQFDFTNRFALFTEHHWNFIMLGLGWTPRSLAAFQPFVAPDGGAHLMAMVANTARQATAALPDHRAYFAPRPGLRVAG